MGATVAGAALAALIGWRLSLQSLDAQIRGKRAALKKLALSGGIPPTQDVMDHLTAHQLSLEGRYQHWLKAVTAPPLADAVQADPQLYFQEHLHEVQRTLDRLAAARGVPVPEQLGFPKELPPPDAVPRLLAQLALLEEATTLLFEQDVPVVSSLKIEDPEPVPDQEAGAFLQRLPVRVRLSASLPRLMQALGALARARPLIDVRALRVQPASPGGSPGASGERLDAELVLARYLVVSATTEPAAAEPETTGASKPAPATKPRTRRAPSRAKPKPE